MIQVSLYGLNNRLVEQVLVPDFSPGDDPVVLAWGSRFFVIIGTGVYHEVKCLQVFTERETQAMA